MTTRAATSSGRFLMIALCLATPAWAQAPAAPAPGRARCVVLWQEGFPAVESETPPAEVLRDALARFETTFAGTEALAQPGSLNGVDLLVLPYGSAFPVELWPAILDYVKGGGNLLNLGGRPFFVPVARNEGVLVRQSARNAYARELGLWHSYETPRRDFVRFTWDDDLPAGPALEVRARRVFVLATGRNRGYYKGLAFLSDARGEKIAAAVTRHDFIGLRNGPTPLGGSRSVFLPFEPEPGYWSTPAGRQLVKWAAEHAARGAINLWLQAQNATLAPGEAPQAILHVQRGLRTAEIAGRALVRVELTDGRKTLETRVVECVGGEVRASLAFHRTLPPGFYVIRGRYEDQFGPVESTATGVWSRDEQLLRSGAALRVDGDYFRRGEVAYLPIGVNYFSTDAHTSGLFVGENAGGNAYAWERDFAEMERRGITFCRTGTWLNQVNYLDTVTGGVEERYLRGIEAFLHSAARHGLQVQFTFFAFDPQTIRRSSGESTALGAGSNPYLDPVAVQAQSRYVASIVGAFKDVPFLSWDLINEPNFANPRRLWSGNVPNGDPVELAAWRSWLRTRYQTAAGLARAWNTTPEALGGDDLGGVPMPGAPALEFRREGSTEQARAVDYNLFAQEMFTRWISQIQCAIRVAGGRQPVVVGQDEGGVTDRVLNQFYADAGLAFTSNHSWWQDDALLWDAVAAKRPDLPNFVGETGVQPAWRADGAWRHDEVTAAGLVERKLALGLAAANGGALHWDWARGDVFGLKRSDGSDKVWLESLGGIAAFARQAAPLMGHTVRPEVAIVLPQSLQLSTLRRYALEGQQKCVRALYHHARGTAYAVGEYQLRLLGQPRLILLPAPWVLSEEAWRTLLAAVDAGAVLAVSGPLDLDEHFQSADRLRALGIAGGTAPLQTRENRVRWDDAEVLLSYGGDKTTYLERAVVDGDQGLVRVTRGRGRILYSPWPVELNDNMEAIGAFYRTALREASVTPVYSTELRDPGILICPTRLDTGTLYVLTSESSAAASVAFRDATSGASLEVPLLPGRAALLLVRRDGQVTASYNPSQNPPPAGGAPSAAPGTAPGRGESVPGTGTGRSASPGP